MILAYALEGETVPHIRELPDHINLTGLIRGLYRRGVVFVEVVRLEGLETAQTRGDGQ